MLGRIGWRGVGKVHGSWGEVWPRDQSAECDPGGERKLGADRRRLSDLVDSNPDLTLLVVALDVESAVGQQATEAKRLGENFLGITK